LPGAKSHCHLAAGQPKKEWPVGHWASLYQMAAAAGLRLVFTTGASAREQSLVNELTGSRRTRGAAGGARSRGISAVLKRAEVSSPATRPAAFRQWCGRADDCVVRPTSAVQWAPLGSHHQVSSATGVIAAVARTFVKAPTIAWRDFTGPGLEPPAEIFAAGASVVSVC